MGAPWIWWILLAEGLHASGGRATKASVNRGGLPFILVVGIKQEALSGMLGAALDFRGKSAQWTSTISGFLNRGGEGSIGRPIVIGPVSTQGRRLASRETPTQRGDLPNQWKWEDVSKLKPTATIPLFNGFNRSLAW